MNKRQRKKQETKYSTFGAYCYANSYRSFKQIDREYHEFCITSSRYKKINSGCRGGISF